MALQVTSTTLPLPSNGGSFTLKGRSRAGDGTTFLVQELKLMFDMGALVYQGCPDTVFLTHTHNDHVTFMAQILSDKKTCTNVYLPAKALPFVQKFLRAHQDLVECGGEPDDEDDASKYYKLRPLEFGDTFTLKIKGTDYDVTALRCDHRIDCLGYSIFRNTRSLKPEYRDLPGKEIGALRKQGITVNNIERNPFLCYLGDTTHKVFENHPEILEQHKFIVVECSFFCDKTREKATKSKHMHWYDLKPIVESNPDVLFILIHFSLRYSAMAIREFFVKESQSTQNVHPMLVESELRPHHFGRSHGNRRVPPCNCFQCQENLESQLEQGKRPAEEDHGENHSKQSRQSNTPGRHHGKRRDHRRHHRHRNNKRDD